MMRSSVPPPLLRPYSPRQADPAAPWWASLLSALACAGAVMSTTTHAASAAPVNADGEQIPVDEASATATTNALLKASVLKVYNQEGRAFRDAHRKAHGCVGARFQVLDQLPPTVAVGLFAKPGEHEAVIRFSNGSQADDTKGDVRGMAIKVLGVDGPKLLEDEAQARTQDFLLMNSPVFFVRNAKDYVSLQQAISQGGLSLAGWLAWRAFHEGAILLSIQNRKVLNPLASRYWSAVPSKLGPRQMKFSATPCAGSMHAESATGPDRLRGNLQATLDNRAACFDFSVQLRTQADKMPIEDPTIEWKESASPFIKVARITIPAQQAEQGEACEARSFTPWHTLAEHRPLGGIQRMRKSVYQEISILRHQLNGQPRTEP